MGFLSVLLIILLGYYLLKILAGWLAPRFFAYLARKVERRFQETFGQFTTQDKEGGNQIDEIINKRKKNHAKSSEQVGEYIDFEEID